MTASFCVGVFLFASELLIRSKVELVDLFEQSLDVFWSAQAQGVRDAAFGDSIPARGLHFPENSFVNLAFPGERPLGTAIKVRAYYEEIDPGRVILPINTNMLSRPVEDSRGYENIFVRRNRPFLRLLEDRHRQFLTAYWKTFIRAGAFESNVRLRPNGGIIPTDPRNDARFAEGTDAERRKESEEVVLRDLPPDDPEWFERNGNLVVLRELVAWLRAREATVCLVAFPLTPDYRAIAAQYPAFDRVMPAYEKLASEPGVSLVDLRDAYDDPALFNNPNHIGHQASSFSAMVERTCFGSPRRAE